MKRRVLSSVLAFVLVVSLMPLALAFAGEEANTGGEDATEITETEVLSTQEDVVEAPESGGTFEALGTTAPTITSAASYTCQAGTGGSFELTATGTEPITWSYAYGYEGSLKGTTITGSTLTIGANASAGTFTLYLKASNGTSPDATQAFRLRIDPAHATGKDITKFAVNGVEADIFEIAGTESSPAFGTIYLRNLPAGTDLATVETVIEHTGVLITPTTAEGLNSSEATIYTVVAEDGSSKEYRAFADFAPSSTNSITSFKLAGASGLFLGSAIYVTVPAGTDLTSLEPVIAHNGISINLTGSQDFSAPVTYAVTAEDGSSKTYRVFVSVAANPEDPEHEKKPAIDASDFGSSDGTGDVVSIVTEDLLKDESNFEGLYLIVGNELRLVARENYTLERGSTKITLLESYLKTLGSGSYTFAAIYINGLMATIDLQVALPTVDNPSAGSTGSAAGTGTGTGSALPATGDSPVVLMAVIIVLLGGAALTSFALLRRRAVK